MSTNYYFRNKEEYDTYQTVMTKRNKAIKSIMQQLEEWSDNEHSLCLIELKLKELAIIQYEEIHIGKRSAGWKPLFKKQSHYSCLIELKEFYLSNKDKYDIVNEYGDILSWNELYNELIMHHGNNHLGNGDIYKDFEGYTWCLSQFE